MKKYLMFVFFFAVSTLPLVSLGQLQPVEIINSPFLYKPGENYNDCDNSPTPVCFVDSDVPNLLPPPAPPQLPHRGVPVRIRIPRNAPPGRLPLIIWSHGGGLQPNGRALNEVWGRTLTRAGYIVIHMSHLEHTPEQRAAACLEFAAANQNECLNLPMVALYQSRDANVVLGALDWLEQNVALLNGRIDRDKIAVAGWSGGSLTALSMAGARFRLTAAFPDVSFSNPLPKAFLANSPQGPDYAGFKTDSWREIFRPVLTATGPGDTTSGEDAPSRLVAFRSMPAGKKYQVYVNHPATTHDTFNLQNDNFPISKQWLASYSLAYFDSHLKNKPLAGAFLISNRLPLQGSRKTVLIYRK